MQSEEVMKKLHQKLEREKRNLPKIDAKRCRAFRELGKNASLPVLGAVFLISLPVLAREFDNVLDAAARQDLDKLLNFASRGSFNNGELEGFRHIFPRLSEKEQRRFLTVRDANSDFIIPYLDDVSLTRVREILTNREFSQIFGMPNKKGRSTFSNLSRFHENPPQPRRRIASHGLFSDRKAIFIKRLCHTRHGHQNVRS